MSEQIFFSDHDLEVFHNYKLEGNLLTVDDEEYYIKSAADNSHGLRGYYVIKK